MSKFFKRLFCKHQDQTFIRNIYGDEINLTNGKRSVWRCKKCEAVVWRDSLVQARGER